MKRKMIIGGILVIVLFIGIWTTPDIQKQGTIKIYDRNNILLYESEGRVGHKIPVRYEQLPKNVINATIAAEDETFWSNPGIDIPAMFRSLYLDITRHRIVSGASTITQQLARYSVIKPHEMFIEKSVRKVREIITAVRIYFQFSKKTVLTDYLNTVYYGEHAYGIQTASNIYFHKDISQLSLAEASLLTGILPSPDEKNPYIHMAAAKKAQEGVLDLMVKNGYISKTQAQDAKNEPISLFVGQDSIKAPYFVDYILQQLQSSGVTDHQGISVYTTLDYPTYQLSNRIASLWITNLKKEHDLSNAALVLLDNKTGAIIDMMGGIDYSDLNNQGKINMATALRQPGSALKPITYATAFMKGFTPATLLFDVQKVYKTRTGEGYTPNNYDGRYHGLVLAREALASSLNVPAVEMLSRIGIPAFIQTAQALGITSLKEIGKYDLSLTLGGGEITLLDLTNVYASFGRQGKMVPAFGIQKIVSDDNHRIFSHTPSEATAALGTTGKQITYLISSILSDPKARMVSFGEKNPLVLSVPAAVKTGTTTDWHDNWTVGYTPDYTVGVWVGNNDNHPMKNITGIVGAAPIWNQFFEEFLHGKPVKQFEKPENIISLEICADTGSLPDGICPNKKTEVFIKGTQPKKIVHYFKKVTLDIRNNLLAGPDCPKAFVLSKILLDYPPQVYTWAVENNQQVIPLQPSPLCGGVVTSQGNSFVSVIYPKEKSVFENSPQLIENQVLDLEANVSPDITKISWFIDGKDIDDSSQLPFTGKWIPVTGNHILSAVGTTNTGTSVHNSSIHFSVVTYKDNY